MSWVEKYLTPLKVKRARYWTGETVTQRRRHARCYICEELITMCPYQNPYKVDIVCNQCCNYEVEFSEDKGMECSLCSKAYDVSPSYPFIVKAGRLPIITPDWCPRCMWKKNREIKRVKYLKKRDSGLLRLGWHTMFWMLETRCVKYTGRDGTEKTLDPFSL